MSDYFEGPHQAPYPPQGPYYGAQQPYPQQSTPYPEQSAPYPQQSSFDQRQGHPPSQQNNYAQPLPQQQHWDPAKIYAEANSSQAQYSALANNSRSGAPFTGNARSADPFAALQGNRIGDGERGIGAAVVGGGAGAFLGHEMGHSKMATLGGLVAGAIAAEALEHHEKKKHRQREEVEAYDEGYLQAEHRDLGPHHHRVRGLDDETYSERGRERTYEDEYAPPHHHHHHEHHYHDRDEEYADGDSYCPPR